MNLSLSQLLVLIGRVEQEVAESLQEYQKGAFKNYKKTALLDKEIIMEEIALSDHLAYLERANELRKLLENLKELRRTTNRETVITYADAGVEKELSIADAIEEAKHVQRLINTHERLTRYQPISVYTNVAENTVTEYTHDIEGYKNVVKVLQKTKDSISQAINRANVEVTVNVEGAEEFL